ncbi:MAG: T9SS type A sorting domain-containing protein [Cytophagales bacterium]|nr:T9SS type A sorting domain-containing protein [Cytophagales bacterium]
MKTTTISFVKRIIPGTRDAVLRSLGNGSLMLAFAIIFSYNAHSQSNFNLEIDQVIQGNNLVIDFYIQKTSGNDFALGSSDFAVELSSQNLDLVNKTKVNALDGPWDMDFDPVSYLGTGLGGAGNFINLTVSRNTLGSGTGQMVTAVRTRIARILIPITNGCGTNTAKWIKRPVALNQFAAGNIKSFANFIDPAPDFPLCVSPVIPGISASGSTSICDGQSVILTTDYSGTVQWYLNGTAIAGASDPTYSASTAGDYSVKITDCACGDFSSIISISVDPLPEVPLITQAGGTLVSSVQGQISWYFNSVLINGATQQTYTPTESGDYSVALTNNCGTAFSDPYTVLLSGIANIHNVEGFSVYPNPYYNETVISYHLESATKTLIEIYNILGVRISTLVDAQLPGGDHNIQFSANQPGIYFLKVTIGENEQTIKLVELD